MTTTAPPRPTTPLDTEALRSLDRLLQELSPEQALWLSGYLAAVGGGGAATAVASPVSHPATEPTPQPFAESGAGGDDLTVLFGTETGNARGIAEALVSRAREAGLDARAVDMAEYRTRKLRDESLLALVAATHGEGDPPDGAMGFFEFLGGRKAPRLEHARFAVLSLGDSSYVEFCRAGRDLDERLEELGAERLLERVDCDVDYEAQAEAWIERVVEAVRATAPAAPPPGDAAHRGNGSAAAHGVPGVPARSADAAVGILEIVMGRLPSGAVGTAVARGAPGAVAPEPPLHSRQNPFAAELLEAVPLTGLHSDKETLHLELSVEGSGFTFEPGDSLGVIAENEDAVVDAVVDALQAEPESQVQIGDETRSFAEALRRDLELTLLTPAFLSAYAELAGAARLTALLEDDDRSDLLYFMKCHQVPDVLEAFPVPGADPQRFVDMLRRLQPRLYSIASSPRWTPDQVDLTVAVTRRTPDGKARNGVTSTWLAERRRPGDRVRVYLDPNDGFRLPSDPERPLIMIGAGTGVAPFRAFLQDRQETGARGRTWLFFGERRFREDFLYQTEWQRFLRDGVLNRMDVAFSRDQPHKVYVQDRLRERAPEVHTWLEEGAALYVCGDATGMAPGVHEALVEILTREGGHSPEDAEDRLRRMRADGRYQRDVY
jgi:sulfite reductase (NADPH) flavoprotein alpha-component